MIRLFICLRLNDNDAKDIAYQDYLLYTALPFSASFRRSLISILFSTDVSRLFCHGKAATYLAASLVYLNFIAAFIITS